MKFSISKTKYSRQNIEFRWTFWECKPKIEMSPDISINSMMTIINTYICKNVNFFLSKCMSQTQTHYSLSINSFWNFLLVWYIILYIFIVADFFLLNFWVHSLAKKNFLPNLSASFNKKKELIRAPNRFIM